MAKKKKVPRIRRIITAGIFIIIALLIAASLIFSHVFSRVTYVDRVTLRLKDLPPGFEGKTILFVSDIDMVGLSGPRTAWSVLRKLEKLHPDILILGGDYASPSIWERINGDTDESALAARRMKLFSYLADFHAPMGKYAVAGENDDMATLSQELSIGNIQLLSDSSVQLMSGGGVITLAGLSDYSGSLTNYSQLASTAKSTDCVIAAAHNPASITGILTAEASGGGQWCDAVLSGHTHGGQAVVAGRSLLKLTDSETRYGAGWSNESGVHVLVSEGLGCEAVNLRFGTKSTVHFITLERAPDTPAPTTP